MIYVISKTTFGSYDVRDIQCNANWDCCPYSDYALIPDNLVDDILATQGYCDITLNDDGNEVVAFVAREIPSVPEECQGVNTVLSVNGANANDKGEIWLPRNLLDNSDFRNPVNQRGFTSGSVATNAYFIDRWKAWSPTQISGLSTNGLQMTSGVLRQDLTSELIAVLVGKRITFAAKIDGTVCVCHATVSQPGVYTQLAVNAPLEMAVTSGGLLCCGIRTSSAITIEWAALYEGEYTAETLPEYQPKGYGAELAECQRYYYYLSDFIAYGYGASYGEFCYSLLLPTKMRIIPTVTYGECTLKSGTTTVKLNRIDQLKTTVRVEFQFITLDTALTGKVMQARLKDVCISADL